MKTSRSGFRFSASAGAAFLMANSSIGPGFLTQTTVFTAQLLTSFGFVILLSVLLDIGAQLNTWRILTVTGMRAQDLANALAPGLGYALCVLVVLGASTNVARLRELVVKPLMDDKAKEMLFGATQYAKR